jgi:hypothetical protein
MYRINTHLATNDKNRIDRDFSLVAPNNGHHSGTLLFHHQSSLVFFGVHKKCFHKPFMNRLNNRIAIETMTRLSTCRFSSQPIFQRTNHHQRKDYTYPSNGDAQDSNLILNSVNRGHFCHPPADGEQYTLY